jgi:hypothetical protein
MGPPLPPATWSQAEIDAARAACAPLLKEKGVIYEELKPLRDGLCGTPAPLLVHGFQNENLTVTLKPAATLTCELTARLKHWLDTTVEPKAEALLHSPITILTVAASYDCRSRNGSPNLRISQHGLANAIDISAFVTASGDSVDVTNTWSATDARGNFIHEVHHGACQIFGTTLGPDADEAHKTHLHLDAIERKHALLCDVFPRNVKTVAVKDKTK